MTPFLHHDLTQPLEGDARGGVIAIGNFDGVHRGHQAVLAVAKAQAMRLGVSCHVLSFEPHPRTLFKPESPVFRLTEELMKACALEAFGLNGLLVLPFTRDLASTEAEEFVREMLVARAGAVHVVSGWDFHFGKGRAGTPDFLQEAGRRHGFGVTIVDAHEDGGEAVSSSRIRRHLGAAEIDEAAALLGYRWTVDGIVQKGAQRGRELGYPTANVELPESCRLAFGIYAVRLRRDGGTLHDGVASFGRRPTFDNGPALLESFLFDFDADLYGERVEVSLFAFLRGEEKFDTVEALVAQMDRDSGAASTILARARPLSVLDEAMCFATRG